MLEKKGEGGVTARLTGEVLVLEREADIGVAIRLTAKMMVLGKEADGSGSSHGWRDTPNFLFSLG